MKMFESMTVRTRILLSICALVVALVAAVVTLLLRSQEILHISTQSRINGLATEMQQQEQVIINTVRTRQLASAEAALRAKARSLTQLLSKLAPVPLLTRDTEPLNDYCAQVCEDPDVVLCYLTDASGQIQTVYRNENDPVLTSLVGPVDDRSVAALAELLQASNSVCTVTNEIRQDGMPIGDTVLLLSNRRVMAQEAETRENFARLEKGVDQLSTSLKEQLVSHRREEARYSLVIGLIAAVTAIVVGAVAAFSISDSFTRPLRWAVEVLEAVARGDLSQRLKFNSGNELGRMATALNTAVAAQARAMDQVRAAAGRERQRIAQLRNEISEREKAQAALQEAKDAAETANRAKSHFLANMSHEIRTPLNAILGFTDVLLSGIGGQNEAERREHLEMIHSSGHHLLNLIGDVLDLSKIEADRLELECIACSPNQLVADVLSVLRVRSHKKGLYLRSSWPNGVPETIQSDPARLRQLLINLVGNAVKFTETGGVEVVCELQVNRPNPALTFKVIDTGVGIAADKLETIHDPFVQADSSVTRKFGGTGLGLAISKRIAEALDGQLTVDSELGKGSVFAVTIPTGPLDGVNILDESQAEALVHRKSQSSQTPGKLPPTRILLVEDGTTNRRLISLVLRRAGATVVTAEDGRQGVEMASSESFDLILMDMQMPVMDGYTAAQRLRDEGQTVPIIALTAHAMAGDETKCRDAGCSGYLTKPVEPAVLIRTVAENLGDAVTNNTAEEVIRSEDHSDAITSSLPLDDPEFCEIVIEFVTRMHERVEALREACRKQDFAEVATLAHWLAGSGGTAGFDALTGPAKQLEHLAQASETDAMEAALAGLLEIVDRIVAPEEIPSDH